MAQSWKTRVIILIIVGFVAAGSALINALAIEVEVPGLDTNVKEAYFFQDNYYMTFKFENGTLGSVSTVQVRGIVKNGTHTNVTVTKNGVVLGSFFVHPNGTVYEGDSCDNNYSIWWIYVPNPMLSMGQGLIVGTQYNLIDPTGFLGIQNQSYSLIVDQKLVYWPVNPEVWMVLGAQASFEVSIYNKTNSVKIATATSDLTCGVIFLWDGGQGNRIKLTLVDTNFPISRNRINMFPWVFILGAIITVAMYFLMRKRWEKKYFDALNVEPESRNEITLLLIAGIGAVAVEFVDIWFYLPLGLGGNLLLHLGYLIGLGVICYKEKYGFRWLIPGFLEIAFVAAITFATGEPYVPSLTAFMGSLISWLCILYISGYERNFDEGNNVLDKIISKFT
ncbi:MAG: hypothetical protein EAX96_10565 [Candidatus Lokiarchaeota archaeon]|nr:hypothetical protein [Candidatus Lokiarchaeota archaeon]